MNTRKTAADGFTLVELLIVVAVIGVLVAIAIPGLLRARLAGNEASAIGSLRAINSGQATYSTSCAAGGFAITLEDLAKPSDTTAFISPDLKANGITKSGYVLTLAKNAAPTTQDVGTAAATCNASVGTPATDYFVSADPVKVGQTGSRYFATDKRGTIFFDMSSALANPIPSGASTYVQ